MMSDKIDMDNLTDREKKLIMDAISATCAQCGVQQEQLPKKAIRALFVMRSLAKKADPKKLDNAVQVFDIMMDTVKDMCDKIQKLN
jgi:hypothetical protein